MTPLQRARSNGAGAVFHGPHTLEQHQLLERFKHRPLARTRVGEYPGVACARAVIAAVQSPESERTAHHGGPFSSPHER